MVTQGGVIGSFLAQVEGRSPKGSRSLSFANCTPTHLHVSPDNTVMPMLYDIVHLDPIGS